MACFVAAVRFSAQNGAEPPRRGLARWSVKLLSASERGRRIADYAKIGPPPDLCARPDYQITGILSRGKIGVRP
eukprot:15447947-Alexandrium_andersonii.AAC.1